MALSTQTLGAPARPGKQNLLFGLLLVLRQEHFVLKFKHHSELTAPRDCWWSPSQHWAEDQPESEPRRVAPKLDHQATIPLPAHKMYYRALHDLSPYWLLHAQDKCSVVFTWGCTKEGSGKKKNKHKGNRKRKRHTQFCFINWKWLALWKPLFFGFRNLPHTHTKKSNSIEGHDYYTENCFPFIKHFCECELIILASILLLAGSKLSWTKKKKSAFKPEPFPSTNGCLWTSLLNLNPNRSVTWNVIISAHFNQFSHTWTEKEN